MDTLVIFTSDNGPVWYEADVERFGHASAGGWRGMKSDVWEGGHRLPFIVRWPGRVKAGTVSEQTICFTDLLATFAEICGATLPHDAGASKVHLGCAIINADPVVEFTELMLHDLLLKKPLKLEDGYIEVPTELGIGWEFDDQKIEEFKVRDFPK